MRPTTALTCLNDLKPSFQNQRKFEHPLGDKHLACARQCVALQPRRLP